MKNRIIAICILAAFLIGAVGAAGCMTHSGADDSCMIFYDESASADELMARIGSERPNAVILTKEQGRTLGADVLEYLRDGTCFLLVYFDCSNFEVIGFTDVDTGYGLGGRGEVHFATTLGYNSSMANADCKGFQIGDYVSASIEDIDGNILEIPELSEEQRIERVKDLIQSDWELYNKYEQ